MSTGLLFALGALISAVVAIGLALPIYGAILDGRYQAEQKAREVREPPATRADRRSAA